jgi:hypothetical protein
VHNTIAHVEQAGRSYVLNGSRVVHVLGLLIAFLLHNKLTHLGLIFFVDGQRTLHAALLKSFSYFRGVQLMWDWFHLEEKCAQQLSLVLAGKEKRNQALEETLKLLWLGLVEHAIHYLREIDPSGIKNKEALEKMIGYLERHQGYIPAYAVRKELGLCNSTESVARPLEPPREPSDCRVDEDLAALNSGELVPLAREEQVVDGNVPRTSYRHDLLGLADRHVRVVLAMHDEQGGPQHVEAMDR